MPNQSCGKIIAITFLLLLCSWGYATAPTQKNYSHVVVYKNNTGDQAGKVLSFSKLIYSLEIRIEREDRLF